MDLMDESVADDNPDTWNRCKMSTSGSDEEENIQPDLETMEDNLPTALHNGSSINPGNESLPWVPSMSLLDLAHKLKQAEMRVFGLNQSWLGRADEPYSEEETDESGLAEKRFMLNEDSSKFGLIEFAKNRGNSLSPMQKGSSFVSFKSEQLSDSNFDESSFDVSKTMETNSPSENLDVETFHKRHQCAWCKYETDSKSHLLRHQKSVHQMVPPIDSACAISASNPEEKMSANEGGKSFSSRFLRRHRCELCSYQTDSKSHLRRHQGSVHSKKKPYKCHLCKMEFSRSEKAKEHFMNLHSDVPYDSRKMRKFPPSSKETNRPVLDTFTKIKLLYKELDPDNEENSVNGAKDAKKITKDPCTNENEVEDELSMMELMGKNQTPKPGNKPYTCLKCDYASRDIWHLKRHISDVHLMRKDYKCKICTYATNRQHRFICHMRTHGEIFCFYCDYSNIKLDVFKQHLQLCSALHKMSTEVQCRLCETDCKNHELLKEHMSSVHGAVLYSCTECAYYSEIYEDFETHSQIHAEEKRTCNLCNIVFETMQDLIIHSIVVHIRTVDGQLPQCLICQHEEADQMAMQEHIREHTPQVYFCDVENCAFKATTSKSLVLHAKYYHDKNQMDVASLKEPQPSLSTPKLSKEASMLKSAALGTYTCPICSERPPFRYRKSFEKHMTQHAVEAESCPLCQDTFFLHKELQEHAFSVHGVKVV